MNQNREPDVPPEAADVVARLRADRPQLTPLELDDVHRRVRARVGRRSPNPLRRYSTIMKSRMAVTAVLVIGLVFSTAGAGLALSSPSGSSAGIAQYGNNSQGKVLGNVTGRGHTPTPTTTSAPAPPAQPSRQVEANTSSQGSLPFTGFAAIPILIGGLALLAAGLAMRRVSRRGAEG